MKQARVRMVVMAITTIVSCALTVSGAYSQEKPVSPPKDSLSTGSPADLRAAFLQSSAGADRAAALAAWEAAISKQMLTDEAFRKALPVVRVLTPAAEGSYIRCTLSPGKGFVVASLEASGDRMPLSGFPTFATGSIVRFSGTVRFPFSTRALGDFAGLGKIIGSLVRVEEEGLTNSTFLEPSEWSDSAATFTGDPADPLSFILFNDGLVYFHGSGEALLKDGTKLTFGSEKQ